jgi:ribosomal protein L4
LDDLKIENPKTKEAAKIFSHLKMGKKNQRPDHTLLLLDKWDNNLKLALRNLRFLNVNLSRDTHAYEVLSNKKLIITKDGLKELTNRLKK